MSGKPKVLIVEDVELYQKRYAQMLKGKVELLQALDLKDGKRLFLENPDISLVVMDACISEDTPNSIPLVKKIRETFTGPIIAASADPSYRKFLVDAGCSHQAPKADVPSLICTILGIVWSS